MGLVWPGFSPCWKLSMQQSLVRPGHAAAFLSCSVFPLPEGSVAGMSSDRSAAAPPLTVANILIQLLSESRTGSPGGGGTARRHHPFTAPMGRSPTTHFHTNHSSFIQTVQTPERRLSAGQRSPGAKVTEASSMDLDQQGPRTSRNIGHHLGVFVLRGLGPHSGTRPVT